MKIDLAIIERLQHLIGGGDQRAFEELYRLFFPRLINFSLQYVHKKESAEEIVNDVMVKIWEKRESLKEIGNLETYVFVAVRNLSLNHLKKYSHYHISIENGEGLSEIINISDPQKELEWKEIHFRLTTAIDELPSQCRTVFKLIKEEGFKYKQVAEILNLSPRTVETQLYRAMKKLNTVVREFNEKSNAKTGNNSTGLISLLVAMGISLYAAF